MVGPYCDYLMGLCAAMPQGTRPDASSGIWDCPSGLSSASLSLARYGLHCPEELSSLQLGPQLGW